MANILKRFSHRIMVISAAALLTVGTYAVAQEFRGDHPDTYVVKRGDTLWDIAGRFLKRPWLWPEIWQANPQIANPHLIYPGDVISLAYLDRVGSVGIQPGPRTDSPINAISLSDIEAYLRDLRVVDSFMELPYVVSLEEDIARGVQGQLAYVRGLEGAQVGQRYAVVRATQRYARIGKRECCDMMSRNDIDRRGNRIPGFGTSWSDTAGNETGGEELGNELMKVNVGTVTKLMEGDVEATSLRLDEPNQEVRIGDRLIPVDAQPYDLQFFPHPPKQPLDNDKARVLAVANGMTTGGPRDVIAMSVGAQDGIDNGTVLSIWRQGTNAVDRIEVGQWRGDESVTKDARVQLPDEYAGHVMIFRTFDKVSYGLVMQSTKPSRVGYRLKHPDAM